MAKEIVTKVVLDAQDNVTKKITNVASAAAKMKRDAELASKGLKELFSGKDIENAAKKFAGIEDAVKRFQRAMSSGGGNIKKELRATTMAAQELEAAYRQLTESEKASAEGQALRQHIDALINHAGDLKDTMADVSGAITKVASDTRGLDVAMQGFQVMASSVQILAGGLSVLGVEEEKVAAVQQKLTSIIAITNGLQQIQNALQKESALMMKISQVAADGLFKTLKANPMMLVATAAVALGAAIYKFGIEAKTADQTFKDLAEEMKSQSSEYGKHMASLESLRQAWAKLRTEQEKNEFISANKEEFKQLGVAVSSVADADNLLVKNTATFIKALQLRAKAAAFAALAQKAYQEEIELTAQANDRKRNPTSGDRAMGILNAQWGMSIDESIQREANKAANSMYEQAHQAAIRAEKYTAAGTELKNEADALQKSAGIATQTTSKITNAKPSKAKTGGNRAKPSAPLVAGSLAWYDAEIKRLQAYLNSINISLNPSEYKKVQQQIKDLQNERNWQIYKATEGGISTDTISLTERYTVALDRLAITAPKVTVAMAEVTNSIQGTQEKMSGMAQIMGNMGKVIGGSAGDWLQYGASVLQAVGSALPALAKLIPALGAKAAAEAVAENSAMGPFGWISGIAALTSILAAIASLPKFATGGIVGGNDYQDGILARVSTGEMILNGRQQANLFRMLDNGGINGGTVDFRISGTDLVGVMRNYNNKMGKVR